MEKSYQKDLDKRVCPPHDKCAITAPFPELLALIPAWTDGEILKFGQSMTSNEVYSHIVRGACGFELRRRNFERLRGGRGNRDIACLGRQAQMKQLASEFSVSYKTLQSDIRIYAVFFRDALVEKTSLVNESTLAREFYVVALAAPEPLEAIKVAEQKRVSHNYSVEQFRAYVRSLRSGDEPVGIGEDDTVLLRTRIKTEAREALDQLVRDRQLSAGVIVSQALIEKLQSSDQEAFQLSPDLPRVASSKRRLRSRSSNTKAARELLGFYSLDELQTQ